MKTNSSFFIALVALGLFGIVSNSFFIVNQTEQVIILQFGEYQKSHTAPGLKFKIPFIQEIIRYEKRILGYDSPSITITTVGQKRLVVDAFARYLISDPVRFFKSVKPSTEVGARRQLGVIVSSTIRNVLGKVTIRDVLSDKRSEVMSRIEKAVTTATKHLGLTVIDIRLSRTELPAKNREAVYAEMNSKLARLAKENRAKGEKKAVRIRAEANKTQTITLAEGEQKARKLLGEGEAESIKIVSDAVGQDAKFYEAIRSLEIYDETLSSETTLIASANSGVFKYLNDPKASMKIAARP